MAKKLCICKICGKKFDRNAEQAVIAGPRRYAHQACFPEGELVPMEKEEPNPDAEDLKKLKDYINDVYKDKANWAMITKQIKDFKNKGYTYNAMLKSLIYFYDVKKNSIEGSNGGIGIIEFCSEAAKQYYLAIWMAQQASEDKSLQIEVKEVTIRPPRGQRIKVKLLEWDIDEE